MKNLNLSLFLIIFTLNACVSAHRYVPQTMFPNGEVSIQPNINKEFSTPLHKFIELEFFNDNKEWVELAGFSLETSKESPNLIIKDQESLDQWVSLRSEEAVNDTAIGAKVASFSFALLGLGVVIAEIASGSNSNGASTTAFIAADTLAVAAKIEEDSKIQRIDVALKNAQLSSKISLPPGKSIFRWFVINTPNDDLPSRFFINYTAKGLISEASHKKSIELINEASETLSQAKRKTGDLWAESL